MFHCALLHTSSSEQGRACGQPGLNEVLQDLWP